MKSFIPIFVLIAVIFYVFISNSPMPKTNYKVNADTNVSAIKGLSKYVSQEEIDDFAMRYSDIVKDKEENATLIPLRKALVAKDTQKVLSFLKDNNLSVDVRMLGKRTPLMYSSFYNDTNTTQELLNLQADFNTTDRYRLSPLAYAIENNSTKTVQQLIAHGARFEDVKFVQYYLSTDSYGRIESLEIDENKNIKINYEENSKMSNSIDKSKDAKDFFEYIVAANLVEMAKIVLESGYKPPEIKGTGSLPGLSNDAPKETQSYALKLILKPNYKPMLELCLKYVGKPSKEHLEKAYKNCYGQYLIYKNYSQKKSFYTYLSAVKTLNNYTTYCSKEDGTFTPESYFAWANDWEKTIDISTFMTRNRDKVFYIHSNTKNPNKKD